MIHNEESRLAILSEWNVWAAANLPAGKPATGNDDFAFYGYLRSERPSLLSFRSSVDRYQTVHRWLLRSGKVKATAREPT